MRMVRGLADALLARLVPHQVAAAGCLVKREYYCFTSRNCRFGYARHYRVCSCGRCGPWRLHSCC